MKRLSIVLLIVTFVLLCVTMTFSYAQTVEGRFNELYRQWRDYVNEHFYMSDGGISSEPYEEIIKLGPPAVPYIMDTMKNGDPIDGCLDYAMFLITKKRFTQAEKEEYNAKYNVTGFVRVSKRYIDWWENVVPKTKERFDELYQEWKSAKEAGNTTGANEAIEKIKGLAVPALPYVMRKVKVGDVDLVPVVDYLTSGKAPSEGMTPEEKAANLANWWDENKESWLVMPVEEEEEIAPEEAPPAESTPAENTEQASETSSDEQDAEQPVESTE